MQEPSDASVTSAFVTGLVLVAVSTPCNVCMLFAGWELGGESGGLQLGVAILLNLASYVVATGVALFLLKDWSVKARRLVLFALVGLNLGVGIASTVLFLRGPPL